MSIEKINVCIADDHRLFRRGLSRLLSMYDRIGEITEAENGKELIDLIKVNSVHVVLLDLQMPVMGGVEVCQELVRKHPDVKIIVLSMNDSAEMVSLLIHLGARGFLSKGADADEVAQAIYEVADRGHFSSDLIFNALKAAPRDSLPTRFPRLSRREVEIVRLICDELTMREISELLNISEKTVQNHRFNIMEKLGVHNTAGIVKYAMNNMLISQHR
jgi:two-component system, NarL family, response regulator DegU